MAQSELPPLNWLRAFEAASRLLSFTDAAQELGLTQSAVSQQIKSLETFVGRALFHRGARTLELTEAGLSYLPSVKAAFVTLRQGTNSIRGTGRSGVLEIRSNLSFAVNWLAPRLPDLFARHPWLRVSVATEIWEKEARLEGNAIEIRFGRTPLQPSTKLVEDSYFPVCAPWLELGQTDITALQLFDCAGLSCNWDSWFAASNLAIKAPLKVTYASTYLLAFSAAQTGAGLALGHHTIADGLIERGLLKPVSEFEVPMLESYYLILPDAQPVTRAQKAFCEWLLETKKPGPQARF